MISLDKKILKKYKVPLKDAFDYIGKKKPVSKRKQWTQNQREKWILRQPDCPICRQVWIESNPMTKEHIHPIVLGGQDRDDNHVPLCQKCNRARNDVMIAALGSSNILAIRNRMPAIKSSIEEFLIWCYATINKDHQALENTKHLTQSFLRLRKISDPFSTTSITSTNVETRGREIKSILKRGIEWGTSKLSKRTKRLRSTDVPSKTLVYCVNTDCKEPMNIPNGYQGKYRCPKCKWDQSLLMESTSRPITPASRAESQAKFYDSKSEDPSDYPVIQNLNSKASGLRLPREPKDFVKSVIWFVQNAMNFETFQDCTMAFKETNTLPKPRVGRAFIRIIQGITTDGDFHSIQQDNLAEDIEILLDKILDNIVLRGIEIESVEDREQFIVHLREYFICAKKIARGSVESSAKEAEKSAHEEDIKESKHKQEDTEPDHDLNKFRMDIILMIGLKKLSSIDFGHSIKKLMIERGNEMYNPTSFLRSHGLPRGLRKALETHCDDLLDITIDGAVWHVELKDEFLTNHKLLKSELKQELDASEIGKIPLVEFWPIVKKLKEDSGLTWNKFMELFGIKNTGAMGGLVIKSGLICSTLSSDFVIEKVGKEHFISYNPTE